MRRIVVALVVALLAVSLAGCGGGGSTGTTSTPPPAAQPAAQPAAPAAPGFTTDRSVNDGDQTPVAFPSFTTTQTPAVFADKLSAGRPMVIFFYDTRQDVTSDTRVELDAVMAEYRGLIDLVLFNLNGPSTDQAILDGTTYAAELSVASTPYIIVVDKSGFITWRWKGFAERGVIEREVQRATH